MNHGHTKESLIAFRDRVADAFREKRIRSPVHFPGGEEDQIIEAFRDFRPGVDWLCSNWRNMYHCLLAGMPEEELFDLILQGRSMYVMSAKRRIICSSIVGGVLPIACGLAMGINRHLMDCRREDRESHRMASYEIPFIWVAIGDMTAETGLYHEFVRYVTGHGLPARIVICDNGLSTNADTKATWGTEWGCQPPPTTRFKYQRTMPHVGLAQRVSF